MRSRKEAVKHIIWLINQYRFHEQYVRQYAKEINLLIQAGEEIEND